jgi:hypothetical protein
VRAVICRDRRGTIPAWSPRRPSEPHDIGAWNHRFRFNDECFRRFVADLNALIAPLP